MRAKAADGNRTNTPRRRGGGFKSAASVARGSVDRMAGRQGFAESEVLLRWPEIAGEALARVCRPVKVHYGAQRTLGATLIVQTDSGRAPEVEMQGPLLIDRVNQFYGYRAIQRIKVTQSTGFGRAGGFAEEQAPFALDGAGATPEDNDRERAKALASQINSPGLRMALERMGAHVLARARADDPTTRDDSGQTPRPKRRGPKP